MMLMLNPLKEKDGMKEQTSDAHRDGNIKNKEGVTCGGHLARLDLARERCGKPEDAAVKF